jgi:acetyltransferase-like isoleucine patch superfamily enzyme/acyl carrier protein
MTTTARPGLDTSAVVLAAIRTSRPGDDPIPVDTPLADLGLDSLDRVVLATNLEATTGGTLTDAALTAARTVGDLVTALQTPTGPSPAEPSTNGHHNPAEPVLGIADPGSVIGPGTRLWHQAQVTDGALVGADCTLGKGAYVGVGSRIGNHVKIGNYASIFGAVVEDEAMICPGALLLEDPAPRATTVDGRRKLAGDFTRRPVRVGRRATIGAGAMVAPGVSVGPNAMIAIGAVVHRDVPPHAVVAGNPARQCGWACACGGTLTAQLSCLACGTAYRQEQDTIIAGPHHASGG